MINFICALKCEAKALIKHYHLKRCTDSTSFPLYISHDQQISLTICGVGRVNAADATAYTHAFLTTGARDIWLNIGIAGHSGLDIGTITIAHKITEQTSQQTWCPQIICSLPCKTVEILSCDQEVTDYKNTEFPDTIFEMEAAGFYAAASGFAASQLIHVIKIISDNQRHPSNKISAPFVVGLITDNLGIIDQIITVLRQLTNDLDSTNRNPVNNIEKCI